MPGSPLADREPRTAAIVLVSGLAFEARIAAGPGVATVCWARPQRLACLLDERVSPHWRGLVSFGTCGGLDRALAPGQWIVPDAVRFAEHRYLCDPGWAAALRGALPEAIGGTIAGSDLPVTGRDEKHELAARSGALAVDMESHVVAEAARRFKLPFAVCRVIVDPGGRSLPSCVAHAVRADGETALGPLLGALARRPGELPSLLGLAWDARTARASLRRGRRQIDAALSWPVRAATLAAGAPA